MQILQDGKEQDCHIFLNFSRMAAVAGAVNVAGVATPPTLSMPVPVYPPLANETLLHLIHRRLQDTMQHQMAAQLADRRAASKEAWAPKTFIEAYPAMAPALHKLCGATTDENLPEFWKIFAAAGEKKNQGFPALQQLMMARVNDDDSAQVRHILPAMLYEYISQFRLGSSDPENISHGLSPFLMFPVGYHKAARQEAINLQYTMVYGEGGIAGLGDVKQILSSTAYNIPTSLLELLEFIGAYSITIDVLLGVDEPISRVLYHHFKFWQRNISSVGAALTGKLAQAVLITGVLRAIQLMTINAQVARMWCHHLNMYILSGWLPLKPAIGLSQH
jgi:hypothetical protein